jgi:hypothetical protein
MGIVKRNVDFIKIIFAKEGICRTFKNMTYENVTTNDFISAINNWRVNFVRY